MKTYSEKEKKLNIALSKLKNLDLEKPGIKDKINKQKKVEEKKETEFSEKIDELNQETDTLLEEMDKWQI